MHPQLGEPSFGKWYTSERLLDVVKELVGCDDAELQLGEYICFVPLWIYFQNQYSLTCVSLEELFNLLINPLNHDFALRWHRDDVAEKATDEEGRGALKIWHHGVRNHRLKSDEDPVHLF